MGLADASITWHIVKREFPSSDLSRPGPRSDLSGTLDQSREIPYALAVVHGWVLNTLLPNNHQCPSEVYIRAQERASILVVYLCMLFVPYSFLLGSQLAFHAVVTAIIIS